MRVKKQITLIILSLLLGLSSTSGLAQEAETLFSNDIDHGAFGGLVFGGTTVNGELSYLRGARGAWVINFNKMHAVHLGLARYRTHNHFGSTGWEENLPIDPPDMETEYSGFELEYVNRPSKLFHFSLQILAGSGTVEYEEENLQFTKNSDRYFVLQPGANLILNVTSWFRLSGGIFYRYTDGVRLPGTSDTDLSGATTFVTLRFGWF